LVRTQSNKRLAGLIIETEAYQGEEDLGCHASVGMTPRTSVMYGPPGHGYVYFTYGMHWLLNAVTDQEGIPAAVLIRAIHPLEGLEAMAENRPYRALQSGWTDGPAKLTQALAIDGSFNSVDLCNPLNGLHIEYAERLPDDMIEKTPRIGLNSVPEPWRSIPWRFLVRKGVFNGG
jgi:DNA-3-methyladenine glycosylase